MMAIVEIQDLWKSFRNRRKVIEAVRGVNLAIQEGEVFGFLGPNGAGKTTTLRMLTTLLPPDKGRAIIAGFDLRNEPYRVRACIGYVSQSGGADSALTGRENAIMQARFYGFSAEKARKRAAELLENLEMTAFADRPARTYSGGQRRRLDLALGLVHQPRLLFLDEPSIGLDPQSRAVLWNEVRKLQAAGTTIFLTTHYLDEADQLCDHLAIINAGQIVAEGTSSQLKQQVAGDVITLSLTQNSIAQDYLREQTFVREIHDLPATQAQEQRLQLYVEHGEEVLVTVIHLLDSIGVTVHSVTLARPSLDDVFLRLTGHSLTDVPSQIAGNSWGQ
jgi:ABC-2 type transport system ATP-binding protein